MGLLAYFTEPPGQLAWEALGDANRGARSWPFVAASNHEEPAATTPEAAGFFVSLGLTDRRFAARPV